MHYTNRLGLRAKLLGMSLIFTILLLAVAVAGFISSRVVLTQYERILSVNLAQERALAQMTDSAKDLIRHISKLSLTQMKPAEVEVVFKKVDELKARYQTNETALKELPLSDDDQDLYAKMSKDWQQLNSNSAELIGLFKSNSKPEERAKLVQIYYADLEESVNAFFGRVQEFQERVRQHTQESSDHAVKVNRTGNLFSISIVLIGVLLSVGLGLVFANVLSRQLSSVTEALTGEIETLSSVLERLVQMGSVLLRRTEEQAESVETTATAMNQISAMVSKSAESASISNEKSQESLQVVHEGAAVVSHLNQAIDRINESNQAISVQVEDSHAQMREIAKLMQDIQGKTRVIHDIVFQTKLLSFNASIEAARAGEAGKGFSVVAEEVGNLAKSSGAAASEIGASLVKNVEAVETMVSETSRKLDELIRDSQGRVEQGKTASVQCARVFENVVGNVEQVIQQIKDISSAGQEQSAGVSQVNRTIESLGIMARENRTLVSDFQQATDTLNQQSMSLRDALSSLRAVLSGRN